LRNRNKNIPVEQAGYMAGFSDKKQFYAQFKKYYNTTPAKYRKESGKVAITHEKE